jgi:hypothetical protein
MLAITGGHLPVFRIPGTHHHLMFDEPVASAMATKAIVLEWLREDHADVMRATLARAVPPAP